jgi:SAM-dependent methyltransferase
VGQVGFSEGLIERSGYARDGFADGYDSNRPAPPSALLDILLLLLAQVERPQLVVDLGAGTGLSSRAWADRAHQVIGVEANPSMLARARVATSAANVSFLSAFAADTGLPAECADVVTCAQAFHWMEPGPVLAEIARLLRPGGIFAAYDYDVPPIVHPEVDAAFSALFETRRAARTRLDLEAGASTWPKDGHLAQIRDSGLFRTAREIVCHAFDRADARRVVGLAESIGGPLGLFGGAAPEVIDAFDGLRTVTADVLADRTWPMVVCYRARVGVR